MKAAASTMLLVGAAKAYTTPKCTKPTVIFPNVPTLETCDEGSVSLETNTDVGACEVAQVFTLKFEACCSIYGDEEPSIQTREIQLPNSSIEACATEMVFKPTTWIPGALDICCDTCKCYGDPHCISFSGTKDEWVTCDTRVPTDNNGGCKGTNRRSSEHERECYGEGNAFFQENSRSKCKYNGAANWDWTNKGSRCQINPNWEPTMVMYEGPGPFLVSNVMGERGIIEKVIVSDNGVSYSLDSKAGAEGCMTWRDAEGNEVVPEKAESKQVEDPETGFIDIWWFYESPGTEIPIVKIHCMGYDRTRRNIDRRINVKIDQQQSIVRELTDGFCATGTIAESERPHSEAIHCVMEGRAEWPEWDNNCKALTQQYCKGGSGYPKTEADFGQLWKDENAAILKIYQQCAKDWCEERKLPGDVSLLECTGDIYDFKFLGASELYPIGNDEGTDAPIEDCIAFTNYAPKPTDGPCEDGIDFQVQVGGSWESLVWVPLDNYCFISFSRESFPELFENPVKMVQTKCNDFGQRCNGWSEFEGTLEYVSGCEELDRGLREGTLKLYEKGCNNPDPDCEIDFQWYPCVPEVRRQLAEPSE